MPSDFPLYTLENNFVKKKEKKPIKSTGSKLTKHRCYRKRSFRYLETTLSSTGEFYKFLSLELRYFCVLREKARTKNIVSNTNKGYPTQIPYHLCDLTKNTAVHNRISGNFCVRLVNFQYFH